MKELKRTLLEFLLIASIGLAIGLTANGMNKKGLSLTHNYFPRSAEGPATQPSVNLAATQPDTPIDPVAARLARDGLQIIYDADVAAMFKNPDYANGNYIFVDARNDDHYNEGHIPGAYQLDRFQIDRYIDQVLPVVMSARKTVVYCGGGDCEDSENAALELRNRGVEQSQIYVYTGGMKDWLKNKRKIEKGQRGSGVIEEGKSE